MTKQIFLLLLLSGLLFACSSQLDNKSPEDTPETAPSIPTNTSFSAAPSLTQSAPVPSSTWIPANTNETPANSSTGNFKVAVKPNPSDGLKTDVYIQNISAQEEKLFITIPDVYREHYHAGEFHNGNLYIIRRLGNPDENDNWSDELWRYDQQKQGQKLYSVQGMDFRVSDDEQQILIFTNEEFRILNNSGVPIKIFNTSELNASPPYELSVGFLTWGSNSIWLTDSGDLSIDGLVNINAQTYSITKYDVSGLGMSIGKEFTFNANTEKIACSDYPYFFETDSAQEYAQSGKTVHLIVYDLKTKAQTQIATSITKPFTPEWLDDNTLSYDDPNSEGRITIQFP